MTLYNSEKTWDTIAKSFDLTRKKPWQQCLNYIRSLDKNITIADIACGNGRHLIPAAKHCKKAIGVDISTELLHIVKNKLEKEKITNVRLIHSNATNLQINSDSIDAALFIAALHNIKGRNNRIKSLKEIHRVLKKDSTAQISVWSRWQDKYRKEFFKKRFKNTNKSEFGDIYIDWRQNNLNIPRFYHLYSKREFISELKKVGFKIERFESVKLLSKKYPDNFFVIVRK